MPIPTQCPQCQQAMSLPEVVVGRSVLCLACRHVFVFTVAASVVEAVSEPAVVAAAPEVVTSSATSEAKAPWYASEPLPVEAPPEVTVAEAPPEVVESKGVPEAEAPWYASDPTQVAEAPPEVVVPKADPDARPGEGKWEYVVEEAEEIAAAEVSEASEETHIEKAPKPVAKPPARKPPPLPSMKEDKPPAKTSARASRPLPVDRGGNTMLTFGLAAIGVFAILFLGGGAGAWLYFRQPAVELAPENNADKKTEQIAKKGKPPTKKIDPGEEKPPKDSGEVKPPPPEEKDPPIEEGPIPELIPVNAADLAIKAPSLEADQVTRELPEIVEDVAVGGDGRFLLLHMPKIRKVAMFDANEGRVVHSFPTVSSKVRFAASQDRLVMIFPGGRGFQRWNLHTKEREVATVLPGSDSVKNVLMGCASNGPLLVAGESRDKRSSFTFYDLSTFKPLEIVKEDKTSVRSLGEYQARVSADGAVFGAWGQGAPSGFQTYVLVGNQLKGHYEHTSVGHIVPGPDGRFVFTGGGVFTNDVKPVGANIRNGNGKFTLPAVHGDYYLRVNLTAADLGIGDPRENGAGPSVDIMRAGEDRNLFTLTNLQLGVIDRTDRISLDKRIYFIPQAKLIVTLPAGNKKLVLRRFDLDDALDKAGIDYLYVASRPPLVGRQGDEIAYPIVVRSKKRGVQFKLEAGPKGMTLSKDGVIEWKVPADHPPGEVNVIVTISDKSGQEILHTFRMMVMASNGATEDRKEK